MTGFSRDKLSIAKNIRIWMIVLSMVFAAGCDGDDEPASTPETNPPVNPPVDPPIDPVTPDRLFDFLAGEHSVVFDYEALRKPITVRYYIPESAGAQIKVLFAMHDSDRDAQSQISYWKDAADEYGVAVFAPCFSAADFPGANNYLYAGVSSSSTSWAQKQKTQWTCLAIEALFDAIKQDFESAGADTGDQYDIWGDGGGAQFVHRMLLHLPEARVRTALISNGDSYLVPRANGYGKDNRFGWPHSLKGASVSTDDLKTWLGKRLIVQLGTADKQWSSELPYDYPHLAQGTTRFARGRYFFDNARVAAQKAGCSFNWDTVFVNGVGHDPKAMIHGNAAASGFSPRGAAALLYGGGAFPRTAVVSQGLLDKVNLNQARSIVYNHPGLPGKTITLYYYIPSGGDVKEMPIVFSMHGADKVGLPQINNWKTPANYAKVIVLAPEFDSNNFPNNLNYQYAGVSTSASSYIAKPEEQWTISAIEHIFDFVRTDLGNNSITYDMWGHSAGCQIIHRYLLHTPDARVRRAVAANAGVYMMADTRGYGSASYSWPFSLKGTTYTERDLKAYFSKDFVLLLGDKDIDPAAADLPTTTQAVAQGAHRYARGNYFFSSAQANAQRLGYEFNWSLGYVPGVAHAGLSMLRGTTSSGVYLSIGGARKLYEDRYNWTW